MADTFKVGTTRSKENGAAIGGGLGTGIASLLVAFVPEFRENPEAAVAAAGMLATVLGWVMSRLAARND